MKILNFTEYKQTQQDRSRDHEAQAEELRRREAQHQREQEELKRQKREAEARQRRAEEELNRFRQRRSEQNGQETTGTKTKFPRSLQEAYEVLGTKPGLSMAEYKRIYRQEVARYHPDRVNHLGERLQKQAEEEMKRINRAWEIIEKDK